ncbi:tyrosine-type recombinase/integrase [Glaciimonas sp. Gout2]|uniref:tyrosine-type recombinase/integrase n=1 Tax=unclassified Glaciimonas TaxID=2644401 RepID=UPI002B234DFC|nr:MULTISPECIES: tyrosine-type recombinase/integrase [unclassified Glaciimonas]MEB0014346.1 tyrosine-type recombinase/integrase [Glaciimonas sp. Cout2]MEB0084215.1 tyrosine-type recombinase/integrase [Glaciimonas sp. Gout2]
MTEDLFDIPDIWKTAPLVAFNGFITSDEFLQMSMRPGEFSIDEKPRYKISSGSKVVYAHMFGNFLRWLEEQGIDLASVTADHLRVFLDVGNLVENKLTKNLNSLIRLRYLRLLEKVFAHLNTAHNPARKVAQEIGPTEIGRDKPKAYLSADQQQAYLKALLTPCADEVSNPIEWNIRRDRAMQALMLGAGLKVSEVIQLRTNKIGKIDMDGTARVTIEKIGIGKVHDTHIKPFAVKEVLAWVKERTALKIPGPYLFPPTLSGIGKNGSLVLNKATVYRHVKETLEQAGIEKERMGGRTLRNTFAVQLLQDGATLSSVSDLLGHHDQRSTLKYKVGQRKKFK